MKVDWVPAGQLFTLQRRGVEVRPDGEYREIGVRSFGRGLFVKEPVLGADLGRKKVFAIREGDLVVSNVFGWEGAVGLATAQHSELIGSHRFMTWAPAASVDVDYVLEFFRSRRGVQALSDASPGSAGRNRTLSISGFERIEVPLPRRSEQASIAARLKMLEGRIAAGKAKFLPMEALTLIPELTEEILNLSSGVPVRLADLTFNRSIVIHPGAPLRGASSFVGLEHIESHSGRLLGDRPLGNESGRKLLFKPGDVTYGYLRPYLNKAWVADRVGLCSVEQFVLRAREGVMPELLSAVLRSTAVLKVAKAETNNLQLPRLSLRKLMGIDVPDIRQIGDPSEVLARLTSITAQIGLVARRRVQLARLNDAILPAARNEIFESMR